MSNTTASDYLGSNDYRTGGSTRGSLQPLLNRALQAAVPELVQVSAEQLLETLEAGYLWEGLDQLRDDLTWKTSFGTLAVGSAATATAVMTVGYVAWTIRGGYLLASVLSSVPAWRLMDPLPVIHAVDEEEDNDKKSKEGKAESESLQSMVQSDDDPTTENCEERD